MQIITTNPASHPCQVATPYPTATPERVQTALLDCAEITPREREVLERRFGLHGKSPQTLEKIAERIGVANSSIVWRIQNRALEKLRLAPPTQAQWRSRTFLNVPDKNGAQ